ncbi:hypothetical protein GA0111570_1198 [Raineyella antarctica]|uniref:TM2 domain-containing protein n=1 Tax=Raineyella antarctica TaxID=1577474 RepID=A0A1G6IN08_9ACTN|nr:TM2 domain-containing protein [Raineyella antarctica]SDC07801.1 hypothetical protein GA0111570_1198 [Raineyella antarctica]
MTSPGAPDSRPEPPASSDSTPGEVPQDPSATQRPQSPSPTDGPQGPSPVQWPEGHGQPDFYSPQNPPDLYPPQGPTYEQFYGDIYHEPAPPVPAAPEWAGQPGSQPQDLAYPPQQQAGYPYPQQQGYPYPPQQAGYPYPQPNQPDYPYPPQQRGYPYPTQQVGYPVGTTPPRDVGLGLLLTAVGLLGVAGLQYFYIGKIGKGVGYLLTAGWFGIGTIVSFFTISDEVLRTNEERRRGLR